MVTVRVLFDHALPFALAHGGFQTQIEQTKAALQAVDVEIDFLRWWDEKQAADVIHYFGRPTLGYIEAAHRKGIKVVIAELLTATGSRSSSALRAQRALIRLSQALLPGSFTARLAWDAFEAADAIIANTPWEARLMELLFRAPTTKVHVVSNGVEAVFLHGAPEPRGEFLVCTATITERKRVLELAEAAVMAGTRVWVIGRPYSDSDSYGRRFLAFARQHSDIVRYDGPIADRAELASAYRRARGFVLLSTMETLSLSSFEAAACGCPLLLSRLPWATMTFGENARYCSHTASVKETAQHLRAFYDAAPSLPAPPRPATWEEIGLQLRGVYETILRTSR